MADKPIKSFRDLDVYQNAYAACIKVHRELLPKIPSHEKYDLLDQLSRSTKAVPRLIAEGYAKRHQKSGFQKYLDDAMGECNESIVGIEQCRDLYGLNHALCDDLVHLYDICGRQLYKLALVWRTFKKQEPNPTSSPILAS